MIISHVAVSCTRSVKKSKFKDRDDRYYRDRDGRYYRDRDGRYCRDRDGRYYKEAECTAASDEYTAVLTHSKLYVRVLIVVVRFAQR